MANGREYAARGLTGPSQRAEAIFCLSHYLFYGDPEFDKSPLGYGYETERAWVIEQLLKAKHNQQSKDINGARADALAQIERASNWVPTHKRDNNTVAYEPVIPDSWVRHNQNLREKSRAKIERAVVDIVQHRRSFSVRDLANSAGVCEKTLYKHKDLWGPNMKPCDSWQL